MKRAENGLVRYSGSVTVITSSSFPPFILRIRSTVIIASEWGAPRIEKSAVPEACRFNHQHVALPMANRVARIIGRELQIIRRQLLLVHAYETNYVIELVDHHV